MGTSIAGRWHFTGRFFLCSFAKLSNHLNRGAQVVKFDFTASMLKRHFFASTTKREYMWFSHSQNISQGAKRQQKMIDPYLI
jgi:hypothetical protein